MKKVAVKVSEKKQKQYDTILSAMRPGQKYAAAHFCDLLGVKISRAKIILKELADSDEIEIMGTYRNRRYMLKTDNAE